MSNPRSYETVENAIVQLYKEIDECSATLPLTYKVTSSERYLDGLYEEVSKLRDELKLIDPIRAKIYTDKRYQEVTDRENQRKQRGEPTFAQRLAFAERWGRWW